jgi:hypothetical protein
MADVNDMYEAKTPAEFVAWFDAVDLIGNYPAKSDALNLAVELLRQCTGGSARAAS